jgi:hypothetical protein
VGEGLSVVASSAETRSLRGISGCFAIKRVAVGEADYDAEVRAKHTNHLLRDLPDFEWPGRSEDSEPSCATLPDHLLSPQSGAIAYSRSPTLNADQDRPRPSPSAHNAQL